MFRKIVVFLALLLLAGVAVVLGAAAGVWVDNEFQGGLFGQWQFIALAPSGAQNLANVVPCQPVHDDRRVTVWVTDTVGQAWRYNQCQNTGWQAEPAVPGFSYAGSSPCQLGESPRYALAESRLPSAGISCWRILWNWEFFFIESHYVLLRDGRIVTWRIGDGLNSLVRGALVGAGIGLLLAAGLVWQVRQHHQARR